MSKKPSMADTLSRVKAMSAEPRASRPSRPPEDETTVSGSGLSDVITSDVVALPRVTEDTLPRSHVEDATGPKRSRKPSVPKGFNVRPERIEKPHQSIYAHPNVFREIRKIAAAEELKPQDLYREGLRAVLKKRGLDFDKLDRGEV